jgi:hypothetical protein
MQQMTREIEPHAPEEEAHMEHVIPKEHESRKEAPDQQQQQ